MFVIIMEVSNQHISIYTMCNPMMNLCEFVYILSEQYDIVISCKQLFVCSCPTFWLQLNNANLVVIF